MIVVGYGATGQNYDFYLYDAGGRVWNGSSWVAWEAADYLAYRTPATESGGPGRYVATVPGGAGSAVAFELRYRGGSAAASYVVYEGEVSGEESDQTYGGGLSAEIAQTAAGPKSFQTDGQQAVAQPIPDLIKADQYLTRKRVVKKRGFWGQVSIAKAISPGAVNNHD